MAAQDEIPTLAELRGGRGRRASRQADAPSLFDPPVEAMSEPAPVAKQKRVRKPAIAETAEPVSEPRVWSVGELVRQVRGLVERSYGQIAVEGEISNWRPAASGHCYFTLKDRDAQLSIVMFRRQASLLRFAPKDGDAVRLRGQLSVYESRGQMQLVAEWMEQVGMGAMLAAVRELKERLRREGLFDRKRPLPEFPRCIGIVTSLQGAALRDIVGIDLIGRDIDPGARLDRGGNRVAFRLRPACQRDFAENAGVHCHLVDSNRADAASADDKDLGHGDSPKHEWTLTQKGATGNGARV